MSRLAVAVVAMFAALWLSGCAGSTDDPAPKFSPTPAVSSSAPPSSPTPITSSAAPVQETPEAFIKRWAELETSMENTGETAAYRAITQGCAACKRTAELVEQYYTAGGYIHFGGHKTLLIARVRDATGFVFRVHDNSMPTEYKTSATSPVKHLPGGLTTVEFTLRKAGESWNVIDFFQLAT